VVSLWGGNAIDFLKQAAQEGLFNDQRSVMMTVAGSMDVFISLGMGIPQGVWLGNPYWFQAQNGPANVAFVNQYQDKYKVEPSYPAATAYTGVKAYCEALKRSEDQSPEGVVKALEGLEFDAPLGKVTIRPEDHQALFNIVWGQTAQGVKLKSGKLIRGWDPMLSFSPEQVLPSPADTGCKMK
jgi:branched-chain amino acid transport system substrate-binding protein